MWKLTPSNVREAPTAQSLVWRGGHSEILLVSMVTITNEAGFFSEQNMMVWGPLSGK